MTEVFFYIIDNTGPDARYALACKVAGRASQTHQVYIHTSHEEQASRTSDFLWSNPAHGFMPHMLHHQHPDSEASPVLVGHGDCPGSHHQVLINLANEIPDFYTRFSRVTELVTGDESDRTRSRERWKHYKDRGFEVKAHKLGWMQFS